MVVRVMLMVIFVCFWPKRPWVFYTLLPSSYQDAVILFDVPNFFLGVVVGNVIMLWTTPPSLNVLTDMLFVNLFKTQLKCHSFLWGNANENF